MIVLVAKICLFLGAAAACWAVLRRPPRLWPLSRLLAVVVAIYAVKMLALVLIYEWAGLRVPSDLPGFHDHAKRVLAGAVPNRDFASPYGIGLVYLKAAAIALYDRPVAIMVAFQALEFFGALLLAAGLHGALPLEAARLTLLTVLSPTACSSWIAGQDEASMLLMLGAAVVAVGRFRPWATAATMAAGFWITKILGACVAIPALIVEPAAIRKTSWFAVQQAAVVGFLVAAGIAPVMFEFSRPGTPADELAGFFTAGNLWYLPGIVVPRLYALKAPAIATLCVGAAVGLFMLTRRHTDRACEFVLLGAAALLLVFQLLYQMTAPSYLMAALTGVWLSGLAGRPGWQRYVPLVYLTLAEVGGILYFRLFNGRVPAGADIAWWVPLQIVLVVTGLWTLRMVLASMAALRTPQP